MRKFLFPLVALVLSFSVHAEESGEQYAVQETMFQCKLKDGVRVQLERQAEGDQWQLTLSPPGRPPVVLKKVGNDMGVNFNYHASIATAEREVYMSSPDHSWFYTLGVTDKAGHKTGHLQVMNNGVETVYEECVEGTLSEKFEETSAFSNMTTVD